MSNDDNNSAQCTVIEQQNVQINFFFNYVFNDFLPMLTHFGNRVAQAKKTLIYLDVFICESVSKSLKAVDSLNKGHVQAKPLLKDQNWFIFFLKQQKIFNIISVFYFLVFFHFFSQHLKKVIHSELFLTVDDWRLMIGDNFAQKYTQILPRINSLYLH